MDHILPAQLVAFANAARAGMEKFALEDKGLEYSVFPRGACGTASELFGRVLFELTGLQSSYVYGHSHPDLAQQQSHAWVDVEGVIVDITYDQFPQTALNGWVHTQSVWHAKFELEPKRKWIGPEGWPAYPYGPSAAMRQACDFLKLKA
jgi:hypothetical protein